MVLMDFVRLLEGKSDEERHHLVCGILRDWGVHYELQPYATGKNIIYKPSTELPLVAVGSHFDVVPLSAGANDNASAIAVALYVLKESLAHSFQTFGVAFFCFDEEENGLRGSHAYAQETGVQDLLAVYNLELVGQGDKFALWALNPENKGLPLEIFEKTAQEQGIVSFRFDQIVTNLADHLSFREAGMADADVFTITCISGKDLEVAGEYYMAQAQNKSLDELFKILKKAPLFEHYHQPSDQSEHLSEASLQMTAQTLWQTLLHLDKKRLASTAL